MNETIKHAAVKSVDGWIFIGKQHAECILKAHHMEIEMSEDRNDQGFITSLGRYVSRVEAAEIAFKTKQIDKETNKLFSEDLWCPTYNGKYDYSEIEGYCLRDEGE